MILKTNTATRIPVGPLVDPGDFKTAETGLTVTGLSVQIYQTKNDGTAVVRTQITPSASGGDNDMALVASSTDGMYDLELTAAQLNWLGNGRITFYDVDGFIVHWIDIQVVSAAYFDWMFGSTIPDVNVTKVNGTSQTAKDLGASITQTGDVYPVVAKETTLATVAGYLDTEISDIKAKTDLIPASPAAVGSAMTLTSDYPLKTDLATKEEIAAINEKIDTIDSNVDAILVDTGTTIPALINSDSGAGTIQHTYTMTDSADGTPIDGVEVWVSTDAAGVNVIASGYTNSSGIVIFMLDAGTYYFWRKLSGYNFTNPDTEIVA